MNRSASTIGALALTIASAMGGPAAAATVYRDHVSHGTANCQSALPAFDGNIRKRPLAVANEGSATAFITCDSENLRFQAQSVSRIVVYVRNRGASAVAVGCTLVNGTFDNAAFFPRIVPSVAPGAIAQVQWTALDNNANLNFSAPAISCALPPDAEIGMVRFRYAEEIGD